MIRPPPRSTRTDTLFPYTTLFRSPRDRRVLALPLSPFGWRAEDFSVRSARHRQSRSADLRLRLAASAHRRCDGFLGAGEARGRHNEAVVLRQPRRQDDLAGIQHWARSSEEHTSELQSLMRISYASFCLNKHTHHIRRPTP